MAYKNTSNIRVAVRVRPPLQHELAANNTFDKLVVDQQNKVINAWNERVKANKTARFDFLFDTDTAQQDMFKQCGIDELVKQVVDGYNSTIFAYGQTGSGKTFTMEGYKYKPNDKGIPVAQISNTSQPDDGIVPRSIHHLFELIKKEQGMNKKKFTVHCSYLQVYKEKIYDMLNKSHLKRLLTDGPGLKLKQIKKDHFAVENLYTFECLSPDDVLALYHFGIKNKIVASHNMNNSSSRSHSMLRLTVECVDARQPDNTVVSTLQLVDLAGSERVSQTGNAATKESIEINKSLMTLRQVITALTERSRDAEKYIPYRDSRLTSLLRQSLGGNSFCLMIACLNPCDAQIDENLSTLNYASQASFISNKPVKNEDPKTRQIEDLKRQVRSLTEELAKANETIAFLTQVTGNNPQMVNQNVKRMTDQDFADDEQNAAETNALLSSQHSEKQSSNKPPRIAKTKEEIEQAKALLDSTGAGNRKTGGGSRTSSVHEHRQITTTRVIKDQDKVDKFFKEKTEQLQGIASGQQLPNLPQHQQKNKFNHAANETKDAITGRIVQTVNMMKEVLQGNLGLRQHIQQQQETIDDQNAEIFQLQNETEDLRERLQVMEELTGKDSTFEVQKLVKDKRLLENRVKHLEQTNNNWANFHRTKEEITRRSTMQNWNQLAKTNSNTTTVPGQSNKDLKKSKATLDNYFNDDYEPVRPQMKSDIPIQNGTESSDENEDELMSYPQPSQQRRGNKGGLQNSQFQSSGRKPVTSGSQVTKARIQNLDNSRGSKTNSMSGSSQMQYRNTSSGLPFNKQQQITMTKDQQKYRQSMGTHPRQDVNKSPIMQKNKSNPHPSQVQQSQSLQKKKNIVSQRASELMHNNNDEIMFTGLEFGSGQASSNLGVKRPPKSPNKYAANNNYRNTNNIEMNSMTGTTSDFTNGTSKNAMVFDADDEPSLPNMDASDSRTYNETDMPFDVPQHPIMNNNNSPSKKQRRQINVGNQSHSKTHQGQSPARQGGNNVQFPRI